MGTRSLTVFQESNGEEIVVMYRQYDGHLGSIGNELKEFFSRFKLVNGLSGDTSKIANGMGCLAALTVAKFKEAAGNVYLYPAHSRDCGEEYIYTIYPGKDGQINMRAQCGCMAFFGMPGTKQAHMPVLYDGPVSEFDADLASKRQQELHSEIPNDYLEDKH